MAQGEFALTFLMTTYFAIGNETLVRLLLVYLNISYKNSDQVLSLDITAKSILV